MDSSWSRKKINSHPAAAAMFHKDSVPQWSTAHSGRGVYAASCWAAPCVVQAASSAAAPSVPWNHRTVKSLDSWAGWVKMLDPELEMFGWSQGEPQTICCKPWQTLPPSPSSPGYKAFRQPNLRGRGFSWPSGPRSLQNWSNESRIHGILWIMGWNLASTHWKWHWLRFEMTKFHWITDWDVHVLLGCSCLAMVGIDRSSMLDHHWIIGSLIVWTVIILDLQLLDAGHAGLSGSHALPRARSDGDVLRKIGKAQSLESIRTCQL